MPAKANYMRKYRENNKDQIKIKQKEHRESHKEEIKESWDKWYNENKKSNIEKTKEYHKKNPKVKRNNHLLKIYGISLKDYNNLLEKQNGVCAICGNPETVMKYSKISPLHVDHDHETGEVRGLLCIKCNSGIGMFQDDPKILGNAIKYLDRMD